MLWFSPWDSYLTTHQNHLGSLLQWQIARHTLPVDSVQQIEAVITGRRSLTSAQGILMQSVHTGV